MTEQELIEDCLKGNAKGQRRLFERFAGKMMTVCRRYACDYAEAEDMLQEAFIRIFTNLGQYRNEGPFEGWIRRIVVHTAIAVLQKRRIRFADIDRVADALPAPGPDALGTLTAEEILALIAALPDGYRVVFNLSVLEGYDHNEIGDLLGISPATSRSQLLKARRTLQTQLENSKRLPKRYVS